MEDDEDDFYGGATGRKHDGDYEMTGQGSNAGTIKAETMNESEEEEDDDDSDDDVAFVLEKPEGVKTEPVPQTRPTSKAVAIEPAPAQTSKASQQSTTQKQESTEPQSFKSELTHNGKEGKDFPEHRTSNVDLDADPTWPADGKKITELDIDADLVEHSKPWRLPGTDVTDFFNYGFDEYTWTQYCAKQRNMSDTISGLKEEDNMMKSVLGGMPNMEGGMPDMNQMMQMMMGGMPPGSDPSKMDFGQMMSMMGGMPGMPAAGPGPQSGPFGGQQGNNSPLPQPGQGFQAPHGPSAGQGGNAFPSGMSMEGFNPQQMGMMQQEQQGHSGGGGGGGGRGRGRKGRGYY